MSDSKDLRIAELEEEVESLRVALRLSESWVTHRDAAKREVCAVLGIPETSSVYEIVSKIRSMVAELETLRVSLDNS